LSVWQVNSSISGKWKTLAETFSYFPIRLSISCICLFLYEFLSEYSINLHGKEIGIALYMYGRTHGKKNFQQLFFHRIPNFVRNFIRAKPSKQMCSKKLIATCFKRPRRNRALEISILNNPKCCSNYISTFSKIYIKYSELATRSVLHGHYNETSWVEKKRRVMRP